MLTNRAYLSMATNFVCPPLSLSLSLFLRPLFSPILRIEIEIEMKREIDKKETT